MEKTKRVGLRIFAIALAAILLIAATVTVCLINRDKKLEGIQNEALLELEERVGEYDDYKIVLSSTSHSEAKSIAKKLGATLRITKDGSFATLTLTDGKTIRDIYADDANRKYLESFSADYQTSVSDRHTSDDDERSRFPTSPQTGNKKELQPYFDFLNMGKVWSTTQGSGITVAVIDTGIDTDHPEFAGRISEYSYNATEDKIVKDYVLEDGSYDWSLIEDEQGHGTGVAGTIAAASDNSGTVGIAPSVTILVIKAECTSGGAFLNTSDLVFGLYYAIERDVSVVNMSFGGLENQFAEATRLAVDSDIICVAAAGNEGTASLTYPAADENVISVGALADDSWELAEYSNYGDNSDMVAPGTVYTAAMGGGYKTVNGTSFASPIVAGAVALLCATDKYITYDEVKTLLIASSYDLGDLGEDWYFGFGALDVAALVTEDRGVITFDMMTDELEDTEGIFIRNHTLQQILEPERFYAVFDGWYYDPYYTEPYNQYEDKICSDITLYAKWSGEDDGIPYTYVELDDGTIEIRSYTGRRRYITVPEYIDGKLVTSIGDSAFAGQSKLREISLPSGLNRIKRGAFRGCSNLIKMEIPEGVRSIGESAFEDNVRLSTVAFAGDSALESIGRYAFSACSSLRRIEIPAKVESLDGSAFLGTTSLKEIKVNAANSSFVSLDGALLNKTKSTLIAYPAGLNGDYEVPASVRKIGSYAFAYTRASRVSLSSVEVIEDGAFECSYLEKISIPDSVTSLGSYAFADSSRLADVELGSGLKSISGWAFYDCAALSSIAIPKGIASIESYAFAYSGLSEISFDAESTLRSIGGGAFAFCSLSELSLPNSLVSIGNAAFSKNYALHTVSFGDGSALRVIGKNAFEYTKSLKSISFPEEIREIGDFAFKESGIEGELYIPKKVDYLGAAAFGSCISLTAFEVDRKNEKYNSVSGIVYSEDGKVLVAYPAGNTNTSYSTLASTEIIGDAAFYGTANLTRLSLNEGLIEIRSYALAYSSISSALAIPDGVTMLGRYSLADATSLSSVTFGEDSSLPRISYAAFANSSITSITIPKRVSTIAQGAFQGCSALKSITFAEGSKLESISAYMLDGCSALTSIIFKPGSSLTSIQAHGLEGMAKLHSIDFSNTKLTNIDNYAFRFCESLSSITIPEGVTNIGRYAFYACYGLESVTLPTTLEHIGPFAFLASDELELYFKAETLPLYLDEDWDHGIKGYYLGVTSVTTDGDFKYATLNDGNIAILKYTGDATELDLNTLGYGNITVIGGSAFAYSALESVILPEGLVTVQKEAFYHSGIKSVSIPASVEFIGNMAFADTPIESIIVAENSRLKVIEQSAFENTAKLSGTVVIPASVTTLGRAVFRGSGISTVTFESGTAISKIPDEAFANSAITAFAAPDSVTKIGDGAFRGADRLKVFDYGTGELWLGANAFYQSGLESFHIGENIVMVEEFALTSLKNLTAFTVDENNARYKAVNGLLVSKDGSKLISVPAGMTGELTVPDGIEIIGFGAFEDSALSSVSLAEDSNILSIGYRAFFSAKNIKEIFIPASIVSIDYYAFAYASGLERVTFAEGTSLKGIYEGAFYGCNNLSDIVIPDAIVEISDYAFYGCSKLDKLPISDTAELKGIYSYAFAYTGISGELLLPGSLVDIGSYAFLGTKAEKITIPSDNARVLIIGIGAFEQMNNLTEITLPFIGASYENMDITWFGYIFGAGEHVANSTYVPESLRRVNINADITAIPYRAFSNLSLIEEINLPDTICAVYEYAFSGTMAKYELVSEVQLLDEDGTAIKTVTSDYFGRGIYGKLKLANGVTSIGQNAFNGCSSLASINIPESVTSIGSYAFCNCSLLTSIDIPEGVTSIGSHAFSDCSSLASINIPESVTSIGISAFSGCSSLTSINIPESVTSIGDTAFSGCSSLASIEIPEGVTSIGNSAFTGCSRLYLVKNNSSLPITLSNYLSYGNITQYAKLLIDKDGNKIYEGFITEYIETEDGFIFINESGKYKLISYIGDEDTVTLPSDIKGNSYSIYQMRGVKNVIIPEGVTSIGYSAFEYCSSLASINIPASVTSIGYRAFYNCTSLTSIDIPESVTSIGDSAFEYCSSLISIDIPASVTSIGYRAFYNCTSLSSIDISEGVTSIGDYAFEYCSSLISIDIPASVTSIGYSAFEHCSSLTSIDIPASVTSIGTSAFSGCSSLTSIDIPEGVTSIGGFAFRNCSSLTSINISNGVTSIGDYAFQNCSSLASIDLPESLLSIGGRAFENSGLNTIYIPALVNSIGIGAFAGCDIDISENNANYTAIDGVVYNKAVTKIIYIPQNITEVIIPATVTDISSAFGENTSIIKVSFEEGTSIKSIGSSAFYHCSSLTSIDIPASVTSIGSSAFYHCSSLTSIDIPASVTSIGSSAFSGCSSLTSIDIPESVTSIGIYAFSGCSSLTSINIPASVTSVGDYAFSGCSSLTSINIPESVTSIGNYAFRGCSLLTSIEIPEGVTSIGNYAFDGCSSLTSIEIPNSVTSIGNYAFRGCSSLASIEIPASVTSIRSYAFSYCRSLTSIDISEGVTSIASYAFSDCSSLTGIDIPESVMSIGICAFSGCSSLASIEIPASVTSIGSSAFSGCSSLTSINIPESVTWIEDYAFSGCSSLTSINIPESVTSIESYAFSGCSSLASIEIPASVTWIGDYAFSGCSSLASIEIPASVTSIESYAFSGCSSLTSIEIPNSVTSIGSYAFSYCRSLTSIDISEGVTSIGNYAFRGCSSLTCVNIPESVTSIGSYAFSGCSSLTSIEIPNSVTSIGDHAFSYCSSLTSIEIPNSVTSIGSSAFYGCDKLYQIINLSDLTLTIGSSNNGDVAYYAKVIIDKDGNKVYKDANSGFEYIDTADGFRFMKEDDTYKLIAYLGNKDTVTLPTSINDATYEIYKLREVENVIIPEGVTSIGNYAFSGCSLLTSINIPASVTSVGDYAFYGCSSLTSINIPESVTSIGSHAFRNCSLLTSINIPVTSIGSYAFHNCSSLTSIDISEGVTSIGSDAFSGCSSLASIDIPESVTSIGSYAFDGCSSLTNINIPESVTTIGRSAFDGTAYYDNADNWVDGALYIGRNLISVAEGTKYFKAKDDTLAIAADAFSDCSTTIKHLTLGGNHNGILSSLTNIETLVITELPSNHYIYQYFGDSSSIPLTFSRIVLADGVRLSTKNTNPFYEMTGITIYAEADEKDLKWDDNFPGWNNGNKVVYGNKWIYADFYDGNGRLYSSEIFATSQVIRIPYLEIEGNAQYSYIIEGFDINGDGIVDTIPATSTTDISAKAIVREVLNTYSVTFLDKDGVTPLYFYMLPYGAEITLPDAPSKTGYEFLGWDGYTEGMTVEEDISFIARWRHEGAGHTYGEPIWIEPTCTERGYNKHVCSICGEWYATDYSESALGHSFALETIAPTCTEEGYDLHICSCGESYKDNTVSPLGHSYGEWVTESDASCVNDGSRYRICSVCGNRDSEIIKAVGHTYSSEIKKNPTCEEEGVMLYICSCGDTVEESIGKLSHNYEKKYASKSFLQMLIELLLDIFFGYEGEQGYYFKCTECGYIATEEDAVTSYNGSSVKEACVHQLGDWTAIAEDSCEAPATMGRKCSLCLKYIEVKVTGVALGHNIEEYEAKAPTCTEIGWDAYEACSRCDYTTYAEIPATGHSYSAVVTAPTCTEQGYTTYTCHCGDSHVDNYTDAVHTITNHSAKAPTCTEIGWDAYETCSVCDYTTYAEIPAKGHSYSAVVTAPTCTEQGYTTHTCHCGDSYVDNYTDATGHTITNHSAKVPTCTEIGWDAYETCSVCDYTTYAEIPATGHIESDWIIDTEATESEDGLKHTECTVCGVTIKSEGIPKLYDSKNFEDSVSAVLAIKSNDEKKFNAICKALGEYSKLSDEQKSSVSKKYESLCAEIEKYNNAMKNANEKHTSEISVILSVSGAVSAALSAAWVSLKRKF